MNALAYSGDFYAQAILQLPEAMSLFIDVLSEQEVLRNDAVLLLQCLVQGNPDAQKIAAYNGCLDKVFAIIRQAIRLLFYLTIRESDADFTRLRNNPKQSNAEKKILFLAELSSRIVYILWVIY